MVGKNRHGKKCLTSLFEEVRVLKKELRVKLVILAKLLIEDVCVSNGLLVRAYGFFSYMVLHAKAP